jgi:hypothetical protein
VPRFQIFYWWKSLGIPLNHWPSHWPNTKVCQRLSFSTTVHQNLNLCTENVCAHVSWWSNYLYQGHFLQVHGILSFEFISAIQLDNGSQLESIGTGIIQFGNEYLLGYIQLPKLSMVIFLSGCLRTGNASSPIGRNVSHSQRSGLLILCQNPRDFVFLWE